MTYYQQQPSSPYTQIPNANNPNINPNPNDNSVTNSNGNLSYTVNNNIPVNSTPTNYYNPSNTISQNNYGITPTDNMNAMETDTTVGVMVDNSENSEQSKSFFNSDNKINVIIVIFILLIISVLIFVTGVHRLLNRRSDDTPIENSESYNEKLNTSYVDRNKPLPVITPYHLKSLQNKNTKLSSQKQPLIMDMSMTSINNMSLTNINIPHSQQQQLNNQHLNQVTPSMYTPYQQEVYIPHQQIDQMVPMNTSLINMDENQMVDIDSDMNNLNSDLKVEEDDRISFLELGSSAIEPRQKSLQVRGQVVKKSTSTRPLRSTSRKNHNQRDKEEAEHNINMKNVEPTSDTIIPSKYTNNSNYPSSSSSTFHHFSKINQISHNVSRQIHRGVDKVDNVFHKFKSNSQQQQQQQIPKQTNINTDQISMPQSYI